MNKASEARIRRRVVKERMSYANKYPCYRRIGFIDTTTGRFRPSKRLPRVGDLKHADWIMGGSLCRYINLGEPVSSTYGACFARDALQLTPSKASVDMKCDNCVGRHRATNANCSAAVSAPGCAPTRFPKEDGLYDLITGKQVATVQNITVTESSAAAHSVCRVSIRVRRRVH